MLTTTETRIYVGRPGTAAGEEQEGFRTGQAYQLSWRIQGGRVVVESLFAPGKSITMSKKNFETWFRK